jgi:hypothetical protein
VFAVGIEARDASGGQDDDYLAPELRAEVQRLKVDALTPSTDIQVLSGQLDTLWAWGNALAVERGRGLAPDFSYNWVVANYNAKVRDRVPPSNRFSPEQMGALVSRYTREFQIYEEIPKGVGPLAYAHTGPLTAGEYATLELSYTIGEIPMAAGGAVIVANGWYTNVGTRVQSSDPSADGYGTVRSSNPRARFVAAEPREEWYQWHNTQPGVCYVLEEGRLERGDTITVVLGDTSRGSKGLKIQNFANDDVLLRLYVDLEGKGHLLAPEWPALQVIGRPEIEFVNAVARPSVVRPGEDIELAVRSEDRYKNPTTGPTPEYAVVIDGELVRTIPAGRDAVSVLSGLRISDEGVHRIEIRTRSGELVCRSNPIWVDRDPQRRIYWGDTHGHTSWADGQGSQDGYYRYGRDVSRLDFLVLSEHDLWTDDYEWQSLRSFASKYLDPGRFTPIFGYEWTTSLAQGGHHNVYFRSPQGRRRVSVDWAMDKDQLLQGLRSLYRPEDVLVIPHAHAPGDWRKGDNQIQRVVEITSKHGTFEWFGNKFLQNGYEVGFIGSSDNHTGRPGYVGATAQMAGLAAVLAQENTPDVIFDALRDRACYATTGERILLDLSLNDGRMGQRIDDADRRTIRCRVSGTRPIDSVELVKNGEVVYGRNYLSPKLSEKPGVQVLFEASSAVFSGYRSPRPARTWRGTVQVRGARLASFEKPWFHNPVVGSFNMDLDPGDSQTVRFGFSTRGRAKGVLLRLAELTPDSRIVVTTEGSREAGSTGVPGDVPTGETHLLPAVDLSVRLQDLLEGPVVVEQSVGRHTDRVVVQLVPDDAPLDQDFEYVDLDDPEPGDYYYLRVRQSDGGMAWSSPIWVGDTK